MDEDRGKEADADRRRRERVNVAFALLVIIAAVVGIVRWVTIPSDKPPEGNAPPEEGCAISIYGAVENPGTYELIPGDTIRELITMAGGYAEWADTDAVDLSMPLNKGTKEVIIPYTPEYLPPPKPLKPDEVEFPININTAGALELQALPGIGPALAKRIVEYRKVYGPFEETSGIMNVDGISHKIYENLLGLISVGEGLPWE